MDGKTIGSIAIVIIVIVGGWLLFRGTPAQAPTTDTSATNETSATTETTNTAAGSIPVTTRTTTTTVSRSGITVVYGSQGFSPKSVTVPLGTTVTFVNQSGDELWVASDPHPTHQGYDSTTKDQHCVAGYSGPMPFDQCSAGAAGITYSFTFTKAGTWGYHNHGAAGNKGTIIVTP